MGDGAKAFGGYTVTFRLVDGRTLTTRPRSFTYDYFKKSDEAGSASDDRGVPVISLIVPPDATWHTLVELVEHPELLLSVDVGMTNVEVEDHKKGHMTITLADVGIASYDITSHGDVEILLTYSYISGASWAIDPQAQRGASVRTGR